MTQTETLESRWNGVCVVAGTGKSFTKDVANACLGHHAIAIKQSCQLMPWADVLYAYDSWWWRFYHGMPHYAGEKWTACDGVDTEKQELAVRYGLRLVKGRWGEGLWPEPDAVRFGRNSGIQAINCAVHWLRGPRKRIVLVGFDMAGGYFYGKHPMGGNCGRQWGHFAPDFQAVADNIPAGVEIINASPHSLLTCFPKMPLEDALASDGRAYPIGSATRDSR